MKRHLFQGLLYILCTVTLSSCSEHDDNPVFDTPITHTRKNVIRGVAYLIEGNHAVAVKSSYTDETTPTEVFYIEPVYTEDGIQYPVTVIRSFSSGTKIFIPNSVTIIEESAFNGNDELKSISIPNSVTSIGERAFGNCTALENVTISQSINTIPSSCFFNCPSLTSIVIPDNITTIGSTAFQGCSSMKSISIGKGVEYIGSKAFSDCTAVKRFSIKAVNPPECYYSSLQSIIDGDCTLYVPSGRSDKYRNDPVWGQFYNIAEE